MCRKDSSFPPSHVVRIGTKYWQRGNGGADTLGFTYIGHRFVRPYLWYPPQNKGSTVSGATHAHVTPQMTFMMTFDFDHNHKAESKSGGRIGFCFQSLTTRERCSQEALWAWHDQAHVYSGVFRDMSDHAHCIVETDDQPRFKSKQTASTPKEPAPRHVKRVVHVLTPNFIKCVLVDWSTVRTTCNCMCYSYFSWKGSFAGIGNVMHKSLSTWHAPLWFALSLPEYSERYTNHHLVNWCIRQQEFIPYLSNFAFVSLTLSCSIKLLIV